MALYDLAETCEYGSMKEEMIRDRLVVDIRDDALSQKLQLDATLSLEKAKKEVRQREAVHEQQLTLRGASTNDTLEVVRSAPKRPGRRSTQPPQASRQNRKNLVQRLRPADSAHAAGKASIQKRSVQLEKPSVIDAIALVTTVPFATQSQSQQLQPAPPLS